MKKNFVFLIIYLFLFSSLMIQAQSYPNSPSEIGITGAGLSYEDLDPYGSTGTIRLGTGTYEEIDFNNVNIIIDGPNVKLKKCRIRWDGNEHAAIRLYQKQPGFVIEDCEIDGQGHVGNAAISHSHYKMYRSWVHNVGNDGVKANGDVEIHRCWIGPLVPELADPHNDVLQIDNGTLSGPVKVTCSVFQGEYVGGGNINVHCLRFDHTGNGNVIAVGNKLIGGSFQMSLSPSSQSSQSFKILDNLFENGWTNGAVYPHQNVSSVPVNYIWSGNKDTNGNAINVPGTTNAAGTAGYVPSIGFETCNTTSPPLGNNCNKIENGNFTSQDDWVFYKSGGANAYWSVNSQGKAQMHITSGGSNVWDITFNQFGIDLMNGKDYVLEFDAYANGNRQIKVDLVKNSSPYTTYGSKTFNLTTSSKRHCLAFTMNGNTDLNTRLKIYLGGNSSDVYFDNFKLTDSNCSGASCQSNRLDLNDTKLNFAPNPFKDKLQILSSGISNIYIYSIDGALLYTQEAEIENSNISINTQDFKSGIYLLKTRSGIQEKTYKIVKY